MSTEDQKILNGNIIIYIKILAKEMYKCVQKESVSKSLPKTSQERGGGSQRLNECYNRVTPGGWRRPGVVFDYDSLAYRD